MESKQIPDTGPWEIGAYYQSRDKVQVRTVWGVKLSNCVSVPPGTYWLCRESFLKPAQTGFHQEYGIEWTRYIRLIAHDPRFPGDPDHYIAHDIAVNPHRKGTGYFDKITSPLTVLAIAETGLAPIVGE